MQRFEKLITLLFVVLMWCVQANAQQPVTTFILVRHAEKDMTQSTNDPDLSAEGRARAMRLAALLEKTEISAVYSTPFKRTRQTVEPVATGKKLMIQSYPVYDETELKKIFTTYKGKTVLLSGHSNTVPRILNFLTGTSLYSDFDDSEYGNILIVSLTELNTPGNVIWLKY
ncbi:MAG: histidine phosphatase family protein [Cyclobacteriaceae bacterium]|nr:histidine phosphatase family protein [Cyclobacteriaceae bacterium]